MKRILLTLISVFVISLSWATTYYSQGTGTFNTLSNWNSNRLGGGTTPANFTTANDVFIVQGTGNGGTSPHTMTVTGASITFAAGGKLWVESGATLNASNAITINATGTFQVDNGGTYNHNHTGSLNGVFAGIEVFGATSNFNVTATASITSGAVTAPGLGNFTYSGGASMQCNGLFPNLQGNLTVTTAALRFNSSSAGNASVTINGDLIISGAGQLEWGNGSVNGYTVNLKGDLNISSSSATPIIFASTTNPSTGNLVFNKAGTQNVIITSASTSLIASLTSNGRTFNITVSSGSTVDMGTSILKTAANSTVNFTLSAGAGLITKDPGGIAAANAASGCIQNLVGTRAFNTAANYTYNALAANQVTGTGLPTTVNNLTINNTFAATSTVTLTNASVTVNGGLNLTAGVLTTGANTVIIPQTVSVNRSAGWVNGNLQKWVDPGNPTVVYEIGDASVYAPVSLIFNGVTGGGNYVTGTTAGTAYTNYAGSGMSQTKYANRYWKFTNTGSITFTSYDITVNYDAADILGGGNPALFIMGRYDDGNNNWTFPSSSAAAYYATGVGLTTFGSTGSSGFMAGELATSGITTGTISPLTFCAGAAISIPYTIAGSFTSGNVFTAQLSDATGVFAGSPPTLGTLTSTAAGTISGTIPSSTVSGTGYRVRVIASTPSTVGTNNGTDITIQNPAITFVATADSVCFSAGAQTANIPYSALTDATNYSISGWSGGGFANVPVTAIPASPITISVPAGVAIGTYTATLTAYNATCTGNNYTITIKVVTTPTLASVSQSGTACAGSTATINLTGLVANSLGNTVVYKIGAGANQSITGVNANGSGNASFTIPVVLGDNGQTLTLVSITNGCTTVFNMAAGSPLSVAALPTMTFTTGTGTAGNPAIAAAVCFSASGQNTTLAYSATTGSPTTYSISGWSGGGFSNVTSAALPASPVTIAVPAGAAAGVYTATLTVSNGSCNSSNYTISVTVNALPGFTVTSSPINVLQGSATANLTYISVVGSADAYSISGWSGGGFANVGSTALPASPITITVPTAPAPAVGTYTASVFLTSTTTGCSSAAIAISVNVYTPSIYYSQASGAVNTLSNWNTNRAGGGASPANFTSGDIFVIQGTGNGGTTPHSMTTSAAWTISGSGSELRIENGATLTATSIVVVPIFTISTGGTYVHNANSGSTNGVATDIPGTTTKNFAAGSTVEIQKWANGGTGPVALPAASTISGGLGWGNLKINVAALGGSWNQVGTLTKVQGNLEFAQTGGGTIEFRLSNATVYTLDIGGNLIVSGGVVIGDNGASAYTIHTVGNATFSGGTFKFSNSASATPTLNFDGNFNISGGTIDNSSSVTTFGINVGTDMNVSAGTLNAGSSSTKTGTITLTGGNANFTGTGIITHGNTVLNLSVVGNISIGDGSTNISGIRSTSSGNMSVSCTGNFTLTGNDVPTVGAGGILEMQTSSSSSKSYSLTIGGNYNQTGGTLTAGSSSSPANIYFQNGVASATYTQSGGTITSSSSNKNNYFVTNGKTLTLLNSINVLSGSTFTVNGGGILVSTSDNTNSVLTGSGNFTLASGGKLTTANAAGIRGAVTSPTTGSIRTSGTNDLKSDATIEFNSSAAAQTMGFANITMSVAGNIDNIIINNTFSTPTVTLDAAMTVNTALTFTAGQVLLGANTLFISATGTISGATSAKYVVTNGAGYLKRPSTGAAVTYPVGPTTSLYNPINITNAGTADNYSVKVASGAPANLPTATTNYVQDTWTIAEDVAGGSDLTVVPQWALPDEGSTFVRTGSVYVGRYITGTNWETNPATVAGANPYTGSAAGFNTVGTAGVAFVVGTFPPPPTVTLNQISAIAASSVPQGTTNNVIYNFSLTVSSAGNVVLDEVRVPTTGTYVAADMVNYQLWFNTSNNGPGAGATSIKTITGPATGTQTFSLLSQSIALSSTGYFWVTADISGCATIGNTVFVSPKLAISNITLLTSGTLIDGNTTQIGGTKTISAGTPSVTLAPVSTVAAANIGTGSTNNIIYNFSVTISGTGTNITQVVVPVNMTSAADFTNLQLWYGTTNSFAAATSIKTIAPSGGGTETFGALTSNPSFAVCAAPVTGYFWVTADVAAGATVNNTITATPAIGYANITFSSATSSASTTTVAGGTQTIVVASAAGNWFRSKASGDWTTLSVWEASPDAGVTWNPATLYPTSSSPNVAIRNPDAITVSTAVTPGVATTVAANAKITVTGSGTFNTTGTVVTVNGTIENAVTNASPFTSTATTLIFTGTGVFNLTAASVSTSSSASDKPQIPTAAWNSGSTCKITGIVGGSGWDFGSNGTNGLQGIRQTFHHFIVDVPSLLGNFVLTFNGSNTAPVFAVAGDFTVNNTGSGTLQLTSSNAQTDITVSGNYVQNNASNVYIVRNTSNNTNRFFRVLGNFTMNGTSLFNIVGASGGNAGNTGTLEVGGNITMASTTTLTKTSNGASTVASIGTLNFTGSTPQTAVFGTVTNINTGSGPATGVFNMAVTGTGGVTLNSDLVAPGNLSLTNGDFLVPVTRTLTLSPNSTNSPGGSTLAISFGKTLTINGTVLNQGTFLTPGSWAPASTFGNWVVNGGGTYIHNTTGGIAGPLSTSTLATTSNFIYRGGVPTAGLIPAISIAGKTYGNLTFESYSGAVAMPGVIGSSGSTALTINGNLSIGGTAGLGTVSYSLATAPGFTGDVNVGGNITIVSGNTFTANTNNISLKGNWSNAGSFVCGSSNVIFNSTASAQTYTQTGTGNFYGLTNSNTSISGTVTLNNNAAVEDFLTLNNTSVLQLATGNLNLLSTATKTARVTPVTGGATLSYGTGRVFVQRYMPARRAWRLMAAPLDPAGGTHTISEAWQEGQTDYTTDTSATGGFATQITGGSLANGFDQSQTGSTSIKYFSAGSWLTPANTNSTSVNSKEGWMLFVRGDRKNYGVITNQYKTPTTTTLRPRGQLFIGSKSITSTGMTVVGNPYASAVDYNTMTKTGSGWPFNSTYYVWDPYLGGAQGVGAFVTLTWNGTDFTRSAPLTGTGTSTYDNRYIPSGAAIIVDFPPSATLQIKETDKNANNTTNAFRPGPSRQLMTVLHTVNADSTTYVSDGALQLFGNDFNDAADFNDAVKLGNFNENIVIKRDTKLLSIERRTVPKDADTIFYGLYRMQQKTYRLQFNMENIGANPSLRAFLEDTYLGTKTPVSLTGSTAVEFKVTSDAASAAADRFRLVFKKTVRFNTVSAIAANCDVNVEWKVLNETEVNKYVVERSSNGTSFTETSAVDSKGNSDRTVDYNWIDAGLESGEYSYRIKVVENNGTVSYSDVVKVKIVKGNPSISVYPNPVTGNTIRLQLNNVGAGKYSVRLFGAGGQQVHQQLVIHTGGTSIQTVIPPTELMSGAYQLEVIGPDKKVTVIPIVISRI